MSFNFEISRVLCIMNRLGNAVGSVSKGPEFDTQFWPHTFVSPSMGSCQLLVKCVHLVLVNPLTLLGGLSLPRNGVVRLTDHPHMTIAV